MSDNNNDIADFHVANGELILNGKISGSSKLSKFGEGILSLGNNNENTGDVTISEGTLSLLTSNALADSVDVQVLFGATFALNGRSDTINSLSSGAGTVDLGNGSSSNGLTIANGSNSFFFFAGDIIGNGSLTKIGSGEQALSSQNSYTGGTNINGGVLTIFGNQALGTGGLSFNGGTLDTGHFSGATVNNTTTVNSAGGTIETSRPDNTTFLLGNLSGNGDLTKTGEGVLVLGGANGSYSGDVIVNSGTLRMGAGDALSDSTTVRLFSNALLDMDGTNEAFGGLSGDTGTRVDLSGGARLITGLNNASTAFSGTIFGDGSLVKNGTGTLTLNGINIYSGGTTVSDGTLKVLNGSGTGTGSLTATSGGIVDIADDLIVENGKTLTVSSGGLVDVAFNLDLSGGADLIVDNATVSAGNLNVTSSGSLLNMTAASINADVNITNASLSGTGTINGNLTGIGAEFGPGNSPGLLTINGDFSQDGNSSILFELAGTIAESEYDVVDISGTANLAGELVIDWFDNGGGLFSASEGDVFDIFSAETILGEFDLLSFAVLGGTLDWKLSYLFDEFGTTDVLRLSVIDTSAVPIPAAVWLFGSGLLGLIGMARQKQT